MTNTDLSIPFLRAKDNVDIWSNEQFLKVMEKLAATDWLKVGWDNTVPEHWVGIEYNGMSRAVIHISFPLVIVHQSVKEKLSQLISETKIIFVVVKDFDKEVFKVDKEVYDEVFPDGGSEVFDPDEFTISHLVFATI